MRSPYLDDGDVRLYLGDCIEVMAEMDAESVDAVVCDPPYGLEFMGREWDSIAGTKWRNKSEADQAWQDAQTGEASLNARRRNAPDYGKPDPTMQAWHEAWAREAMRVLKPGGHLLAFGGTRTFHRLTCGIEDAGFEIRDSILAWLYGSGFPKSLDVSKAIDKKRHDTDDVRVVCRWLRAQMERAGMSAAQVAEHFGFHPRMVEHWAARDTDSQPTLPTLEQWDALRDLLAFGDEMDGEVYRLNIRKGEPGEAWKSRPVTGKHDEAAPAQTWKANYGLPHDLTAKERRDVAESDAARQWQGWGTALKPGWEPCVVARKPLAGTVAENVQRYGTGAVNVDGCRIGTDYQGPRDDEPSAARRYSDRGSTDFASTPGPRGGSPLGRWPANVVLDEQAAAMLDAQSGERGASAPASGPTHNGASTRGSMAGPFRGMGDRAPQFHADNGGASRFFYTAKASRADRNTSGANNTHPTVKPTDLMRWLVRLVTPPGGVVLDPFAGSGTTLVAARSEGFRAVGIEREEEYAEIIAARLSQLSLFSEAS